MGPRQEQSERAHKPAGDRLGQNIHKMEKRTQIAKVSVYWIWKWSFLVRFYKIWAEAERCERTLMGLDVFRIWTLATDLWKQMGCDRRRCGMCGTLRERTHKYQLKDVSSSDHLVFVFVPVFVYLHLCICICVLAFVYLYLCICMGL